MELKNIFDSHAHYNDEQFDDDREETLDKIKKAGVSNVCNIGADMPSSISSVKLAEKHDFIYATVGIHPHEAKSWDSTYYDSLKKLAKSSDKVVAIGEIGLDHYYDLSDRDVQSEVFRMQLDLAKELDLPVVIHTREATLETMNILKEYKPRGVVHCYTGSAETAKEILNLGMYIGFTGVVTFKNARMPIESLKVVPLDRIMIETDAPYMTPEPHRGKRNDSSMLEFTAKKMAEIKEIDVQELVDITNKNAKTLYGI